MLNNRVAAFNRLREAAGPACGGGAFSRAELGCLAMAAAALRDEDELELLLTGLRRSAREGGPAGRSDACFRLLQKVYRYLAERRGGDAGPFTDALYAALKREWQADRLTTFVLTGDYRDFPSFFRAMNFGRASNE